MREQGTFRSIGSQGFLSPGWGKTRFRSQRSKPPDGFGVPASVSSNRDDRWRSQAWSVFKWFWVKTIYSNLCTTQPPAVVGTVCIQTGSTKIRERNRRFHSDALARNAACLEKAESDEPNFKIPCSTKAVQTK